MRCCGMTPKVIKIHGKHGMNSRMQPNEKTRKSRESQVQQTKKLPQAFQIENLYNYLYR